MEGTGFGIYTAHACMTSKNVAGSVMVCTNGIKPVLC